VKEERNGLLICGAGRCGSSMLMQMLDAAGLPVAGEGPAYHLSARHKQARFCEHSQSGTSRCSARCERWTDKPSDVVLNVTMGACGPDGRCPLFVPRREATRERMEEAG